MLGDVAEKPATLGELAREAVLDTATLDQAATRLLESVRGRKDLLGQMLRLAAADLVRSVRVNTRAAMEVEYLDARERGIRRHVAALSARMSIYDWQLPVTGKPIGDATVEDLDGAARYHAGRAEFETGRSRLYGVVLQRLRRTNAVTVRDGISERSLARIMKDDVERAA
jgi:hypothetical protein